MFWNHRVFRTNPAEGYYEYEIREVYYNEEEEVTAYTSAAHHPWGVDVDELRWVLEHMLASLDKPVIDEAELERYFEEKINGESGDSEQPDLP